MSNSSQARRLSPKATNAIDAQIAACVYCPPFSLTPGTYAEKQEPVGWLV